MAIVNSVAVNMGGLKGVFKLKWKQFCNLVIRLNEMQLYLCFYILHLFVGGFQKLPEVIFFVCLFPNSSNPGQFDAVKTH